MKINDFFFDLTNAAPQKDYAGILCVDRDGVIIKEKNYLRDPDEIEFIAGSLEALKDILNANYFVAVISNQAGIAKGIISLTDFKQVHTKFINLLRSHHIFIHCVVYCPFHPDGVVPQLSMASVYRKPAAGMYELIKNYYKLRTHNLYMVGDKYIDIEFGNNIGAQCIIVDTGYGAQQKDLTLSHFHNVISVGNLSEAVKWILNPQNTI